MGRKSEIKEEDERRFPCVGDLMHLGPLTGKIVSVDTTPGFYKKTVVKIEVKVDWEKFLNESGRKSTERVKGKKTKASKRKS